MTTTIFSARKIITMDPSKPSVTHVAVRDGRVLSVGTLDEVSQWGDAHHDDRFEDKVLMPGLIEGHSHIMEGSVWDHPYAGFYDRTGPDGTTWPGLTSIDAVVDRLRAASDAIDDPNAPLMAWGFDPIFFGERRMCAADLDRVSTTRPVVVLHASLHFLNTNSVVLEQGEITSTTNAQGVMKDANGNPTGELAGMVAMYLAMKTIGYDMMDASTSPSSLWNFARVAQLAGVTTATDLHSALDDKIVDRFVKATSDPGYPVRIVPAFGGTLLPPQEGVQRLQSVMDKSTDKAVFGIVKLVLDGSIQGFTARLKWPGYFNGHENGLWYIDPNEVEGILRAYHEAGFQVHMHTNGNEATDLALDAVEAVLTTNPRPDHRHTLQHCQMADEAQFQRMAALGVGVNLFSNHVYYWGEAHKALTLGPDRAAKVDNAGAALENGVDLSIHSDAPITAIGPLFSAWCAVNRLTSEGDRLGGEAEAITLDEALYTITMGAARSLKMDDRIGSIEVGKFADFAVLEDDPYELGGAALKDCRIWGTVLGGTVFEAPVDAPTA